ncbi:MAG: ATPase, T2SS/T4P/T4SS family [Solirubrobacterales bacterium]|nr:ATPase, T2SS/T4P/T4SS family [Solirubrobacterales bacterium]
MTDDVVAWLKSIALDETSHGQLLSVEEIMGQVVLREASVLPEQAREALTARLIAEARGLGAVEALMRDPAVTEVMINGPAEVWVERGGEIERTDLSFGSRQDLREAIDRMLAGSGRRADDSAPIADARLPDGSRLNVVLPPLAPNGPLVTIRRFRPDGMSLDDLIQEGTIEPAVAAMLRGAVESGLNLMISGATGSGKTTTLAALARCIPSWERVVTIEDAAELRLEHPHVVGLESRPPGVTSRGEVSIRDLVRNALRMRPDRIILGEVRGAEALDLLDALGTGHGGSLSTIHASSPAGAVERLTGLVHQAASGLPHTAIETRIRSALDLFVHQDRDHEGIRRVTRVAVFRDSAGLATDDVYFDPGLGLPSEWRSCGEPRVAARLRIPTGGS